MTQTLRETIIDTIHEQTTLSDYNEDGVSLEDVDKAADAILAAVREALLTHDAVGHAIIAHQNAHHTSPMAAAITAALDAITEPPPESA